MEDRNEFISPLKYSENIQHFTWAKKEKKFIPLTGLKNIQCHIHSIEIELNIEIGVLSRMKFKLNQFQLDKFVFS